MDTASSLSAIATWGGCFCVLMAVVPILLAVLIGQVSQLRRRLTLLEARLVSHEAAIVDLRQRLGAQSATDAAKVAETIRNAVTRATIAARPVQAAPVISVVAPSPADAPAVVTPPRPLAEVAAAVEAVPAIVAAAAVVVPAAEVAPALVDSPAAPLLLAPPPPPDTDARAHVDTSTAAALVSVDAPPLPAEVSPPPPAAPPPPRVGPPHRPPPQPRLAPAAPSPAFRRTGVPAGRPPPPGFAEPPPPPPTPFDTARDWLFGGNTLVRVGVVLLFLGLAFLLRYASERVVIPVELRYAAVAAAGVALLGLGWWSRERRRAFGLLVQGAGVGVLYLTIFAAIRLNPLLSPGVGLAFLVVVAVLAGVLAVLQDAMSLAVAGTLGGFAAPILASTGGGSHIGLFSYFLVLNAGVLGIAWNKAWRPLNVIGFVGTFGIGAAWGATAWQPALTATTEPFLLAFFLVYVAVPALFARRRLMEWVPGPDVPEGRAGLLRAARESSALDGALLFGTPIVAFGLHARMAKDTEYALAFSALALGAFYLVLAALALRREFSRLLLLSEVFISIGVIFASLAVPLALEPRWTAVAWAVEGAGIFWLSVRQGRGLGRFFALLLQTGAAISWIRTLGMSDETVISGSWLGAAVLGAAGLADYFAARSVRRDPPEGVTPASSGTEALVLVCGLGFTALVAPCLLTAEGAAVAWAIYGVIVVEFGARLEEPLAAGIGVLLQVLAGLTFFGTLRGSGEGEGVLGGGSSKLVTSLLIGAAGLASGWGLRPRAGGERGSAAGLATSLVFITALFVLNVGLLFVLPWRLVGAAWAVSGLTTIWLGLWLGHPIVVAFALCLEVVSGFVGLNAAPLVPADAPALAHEGFYVPVVVALSAWLAAWRMHRGGRTFGDAAPPTGWLLVVWAAGWWAWAWAQELARLFDGAATVHLFFLLVVASGAVWALIAWSQRWPQLAGIAVGIVPLGLFVLGFGVVNGAYAPLAEYGAIAWLAAFVVHFFTLFRLTRDPELWNPSTARTLHRLGLWLFLAVAATAAAREFGTLGDADAAWRWLGWAAVPVAWLVCAAKARLPVWPFTEHDDLYRRGATIPVVAWLLGWIIWSNLHTTGTAAPLPYLPIVNPIELAYLGVGFAILVWAQELVSESGKTLARRVVAVTLFVAYTGSIARMVHHYTGVALAARPLLDSPVFQAGLSLAWVVWALAQMVWANRSQRRGAWVVGAILVAVVVLKLFLVELADTGSLTRIVSFIGVGVGLLFVGWFAPLPPRVAEKEGA